MEKQAKIVKIAVTGGGSGGHVEPLLAVIDELKPVADVYWIGGDSSLEQAAAEQVQVPFYPIKVGKIRRYFAWANLTDIFNVLIGFVQCLFIFVRNRPRVLFSKAGFVSVPALLAAVTLRIPIVAHESDTVIGLANQIALRTSKRFCTGFALPFYGDDMNSKMIFTGNPVRVTKPKSDIVLDPDLPMIVVLGGSQGARFVNELIWQTLPSMLRVSQIVHQVGATHVDQGSKHYQLLDKHEQSRYHFSGYYDRPELAFILERADLAICRAGANTIADLAYYQVPAIFIPLPLPTAAGDHQRINAEYVEQRGGARILLQSEATPDSLMRLVQQEISPSHLQAMKRALDRLNPPDARVQVAKEILKVAGVSR